jgi:cobalt-precorrin-5B (C1)-methyltransferase
MVGKISKLAQGRLHTHVAEGGVDLDFLAAVAAQLGADQDRCRCIRQANTARHVQNMLRKDGRPGLEQRLAHMAAQFVQREVGDHLPAEVLVYDINGALLGAAAG